MRLEVCSLFPFFICNPQWNKALGIIFSEYNDEERNFLKDIQNFLSWTISGAKSMKLHTICLLKTCTIGICRRIFMKTPMTKPKPGELLPHQTLPPLSKTFPPLVSSYHPFTLLYNLIRTDLVLGLYIYDTCNLSIFHDLYMYIFSNF